ncbi:unnamed protein product, partial [Tilletia controversa]
MDMYIGSSHTFTPEDFVDSLRKFGKSGAGGHAVPGSGAIGAPPPSQGYDPRNGHPPPHQQYQGHSHGHGAPPHQAGYAGYNGGYGDGYGGGGYQQQQAPPPPLQPAPPPVNQRTYDRRFGGGVAAPVPVRDSEPALDPRWSAGPPGQGQGHHQPQHQHQQQHAYEPHRPQYGDQGGAHDYRNGSGNGGGGGGQYGSGGYGGGAGSGSGR